MSTKYNAAYINALSEVKDPQLLFDYIVKLHRENVDLRESLHYYKDKVQRGRVLEDFTEEWG